MHTTVALHTSSSDRGEGSIRHVQMEVGVNIGQRRCAIDFKELTCSLACAKVRSQVKEGHLSRDVEQIRYGLFPALPICAALYGAVVGCPPQP